MTSRFRRPNRRAGAPLLTACAALCLALLPACNQQGARNTEHASAAKERMLQIKSATEWETARQAFLAGDLDRAQKAVERSLAISPAVPKSHVLRGRIVMEKGEIDEALKAFTKAQALDPNMADASYYLGIAFERIMQPEKALDNYRRAADLDPASAQYAIATAEMLVDLGKLDEAQEFLDSRGATFEHNAGVKQALGHVALIKGDAKTAVKLFTEARLLAPDDHAIIEDLIHAQIAAEEFGDAEYNLTRVLKDDEKFERRDLHHLRARCLVEVKRTMEARELLIKLTQGAAGQADVQAWIELGNVAYELNDPIRTRQAAQRAIALAPSRPDGFLLQGLQFRRDGRLDEARTAFMRAAQIEPTARSFTMLGLVSQDLNLKAEARRCFARAAELDPEDSTARTLLAGVEGD